MSLFLTVPSGRDFARMTSSDKLNAPPTYTWAACKSSKHLRKPLSTNPISSAKASSSSSIFREQMSGSSSNNS
eukprot:1610008-Pyramimonas_sp.AAC.1